MAAGFKGTEIAIQQITVEGSATGATVSFRALFCDTNGVVHAETRHTVSVADDPTLKEPTRALLDAVKKWTENVHYEPSENLQPLRAYSGIAESLQSNPDTSDEPGEPG